MQSNERAAYVTYPVHVVRQTEQRVVCVIDPDGTMLYEFTSLGGESVTVVNADSYDHAIQAARANPIDRRRDDA